MDFNNSDFLRLLAPLSRFVIIIGAWFVSEWISKSSRFAGVGFVVEVGFYYWSLAGIRMDFQ